jgi:hypothetical protein
VTEVELEDGQRLPGYYRRHFNAVTRAASDKGRRVEREEIVFALLNNVDEGNTPDGYVNLLLDLTLEEPDQIWMKKSRQMARVFGSLIR